ALQVAPEPGRAPSPDGLARVLRRIDAIEADGAAGSGWRHWLRERAESVRELLGITPPALRWALAVQSALVAVLGAALIWQAAAGGQYRTLADRSDSAARGQAQLHVAFAEDAQEREIRALLAKVDGTLVGGPSRTGVYTVAVPGTRDTLGPALDTLR